VTPPGYKTVGGATVPCGANEFRDGWASAGQATSCSSCGSGVLVDASDVVLSYDPDSGAATEIAVATSAEFCNIQRGQGLYFESTTLAWRARNCTTNNWGVANRTYGLQLAACRCVVCD
jgi:hypothetical protein